MRLSNSGLTVSTTNKLFDCEHWTIQGRINLYGKCVCVKWKRLINIYDLVALHRIFELATCSDYISAGILEEETKKGRTNNLLFRMRIFWFAIIQSSIIQQ